MCFLFDYDEYHMYSNIFGAFGEQQWSESEFSLKFQYISNEHIVYLSVQFNVRLSSVPVHANEFLIVIRSQSVEVFCVCVCACVHTFVRSFAKINPNNTI